MWDGLYRHRLCWGFYHRDVVAIQDQNNRSGNPQLQLTCKGRLMRKLLLLVFFASACGTNPIAPQLPRQAVYYQITLRDVKSAQLLQTAYPQGIQIPPVLAEQRFGTSISSLGPVVITMPVAAEETFTASEYPGGILDNGVEYYWLGEFEYQP